MSEVILYINNTYISNWTELKDLVVSSFTSQSDKFKNVQYEILAAIRDGLLYDWSRKYDRRISREINPDNFKGMTDGDLRKLLLRVCGTRSDMVYRPTFDNHLEIINEYKIIEIGSSKVYPLKTPIPITKSPERRFQIELKIINPINDKMRISLIRHKKSSPPDDKPSDNAINEEIAADLKLKGFIHQLSIDVTSLKSSEAISLFAEGKLICTFNVLPEYIDLGFGIKWATCNLGAEYPSDAGFFFAWGESETRKCYTDDSKYCRMSNISGIEPYDAATTIRGKRWRIPKRKEWNLLYSKCDMKSVIVDGIDCIKFTSRINKKYIILPLAGIMEGKELVNKGSRDCYWSSIQDDANYAFDNEGNYRYKYLGLMIRPIYEDIN